MPRVHTQHDTAQASARDRLMNGEKQSESPQRMQGAFEFTKHISQQSHPGSTCQVVTAPFYR